LVVVVVVDKEERRLVAEEGTLFQSGDDPWEKKRMPVAPAAASSLRAGRGGRWSAFDSVAAAGGMNLDSNSFFHFNYDWEAKYRSFQVRQARGLQISLVIIVVRGMSD